MIWLINENFPCSEKKMLRYADINMVEQKLRTDILRSLFFISYINS